MRVGRGRQDVQPRQRRIGDPASQSRDPRPREATNFTVVAAGSVPTLNPEDDCADPFEPVATDGVFVDDFESVSGQSSHQTPAMYFAGALFLRSRDLRTDQRSVGDAMLAD